MALKLIPATSFPSLTSSSNYKIPSQSRKNLRSSSWVSMASALHTTTTQWPRDKVICIPSHVISESRGSDKAVRIILARNLRTREDLFCTRTYEHLITFFGRELAGICEELLWPRTRDDLLLVENLRAYFFG
ncbi:hypothetical protein ACOSQ2_013153 [Xanthoceras sorbifolium]